MEKNTGSILRSFNPDLPLSQASTLSKEWYTAPEIYELEKRSIFMNSWQWAARADQLQKAGDFVTFDLAGEPIAVTRDRMGNLAAFANVCRHRAARVIEKPCGHANFFQCRYHGWTYDLSGALKGAPEFDGVEDFSREKTRLPSWQTEVWGPFVFVRNQSETSQTLPDFLRPLETRNGKNEIETLQFVDRKVYDIQCNWKVFVDNYLDGGYHVNTVHPSLASVINYAEYRTELEPLASVQISPLKASKDAEVNAVRAGKNAYYWWLYPNLMINLYDGVMDTNWVIPTGPKSCRVVFDFYFSRDTVQNSPALIAKSLEVADQVQQEDLTICEEVQRNLESLSYYNGRFSVKRENGAYYFHQLVGRALQSYTE